MRALTLHQPWASAVSLGIKTVETRSWTTKYRGQLAVHAGKHVSDADLGEWKAFGSDSAGWTLEHYAQGCPGAPDSPVPLPLGAIVATCRLVDVVPIRAGEPSPKEEGPAHFAVDRDGVLRWWTPDVLAGYPGWVGEGKYADQRPWGDYRPGRWAWLLDDVKPTTERCPACWGRATVENSTWGRRIGCPTCEVAGHCDPVPAKGARGLWEWTP